MLTMLVQCLLSAQTTPAVNTEDDEMLIEVNKHYATLANEEGINNWYIATCTEVNEDAGNYASVIPQNHC